MALAGFFPLRRSNVADLMIGTTIRCCPTGWSIELPGTLVKNGEPLSAELPSWIGDRSDRVIVQNYNLAGGIEASRASAAVVDQLRLKLRS